METTKDCFCVKYIIRIKATRFHVPKDSAELGNAVSGAAVQNAFAD